MKNINVEAAKMLEIAASDEFTDLLVSICDLCACETGAEAEFVAQWNLQCREPLYLSVKSKEKPQETEFDPVGKSHFAHWDYGNESGFLYFLHEDKKFTLSPATLETIETAVRINAEMAEKKCDWRSEAAIRILGINNHDILNTLSAVLGITQILEMNESSSVKVVQSVETINKLAVNFENTAKTLMRILRGEPIEYEKKPVDLTALYTALLNKNKKGYAYLQLALDFEVEAGISVNSDEKKLLLILSELLQNASDSFGNNENGGKINARIFTQNGDIVISVVDTGLGIDYDSQRYLTTKFFTRKFKRPGLGLTKIRRFAEDWGGKIFFSSVPAKGTSVEVRFPSVL